MPSWVTKPRQIVAHRGNSWECPENTRQAILSAVEIEADVIEFDVSVTSDGVAVALHGPKLQKSTTGRGSARNVSWDEVSDLCTRDRNGNKTSEPVPAVRDLLGEFGDRTFWNFDIKDLRAIPLVVLMIEELSLKNRTVLSGLSVRQVRKFSARYPEVNMLVNLSRQDKVFFFSRVFLRQWISFRFSKLVSRPSVVGLNVHWRYVSPMLIDALSDLDTEIWTFTVDTIDEIEKMFSLGGDSVTTNRPALCSSNTP